MHYDIIIVGGGIVGYTLACALSQQTNLSIAVLEEKKHSFTFGESYHHRVSAISLSSYRIMKNLGIWDAIKKIRISPYHKIEVWDAKTKAEIHFDNAEIDASYLGYIIENNVIHSALFDYCQAHSQIDCLNDMCIEIMHETTHGLSLKTSDGRVFSCKLIVGADGAQSIVRRLANIELNKYDYQQSAIVATIKTELSHKQTARQVFLPTGPLAFLPLNDEHLCSIVWTLPKDIVSQYMEMNESLFKDKLTTSFNRVGEIVDVDKRYSFPLIKQEAHHYIQSNLALVGDAAHTIHPLAGLGVNIGLLDAASLAEIIYEAVNKNRNYASFQTLRRYERWRKADNFALLNGIDLIHGIFASENKVVTQCRAFGLKLTDKNRLIKNIFTLHAVGNRSDLPMLARL